jgi:CHAT domain-containing protein
LTLIRYKIISIAYDFDNTGVVYSVQSNYEKALEDIKQSFAETQKEMRKKYDPYFWAAFVLIE